MAKTVGNAKVTLDLDDKGLNKGLKNVQKQMNNLGKTLSAVGKDFIKIGSTITAPFVLATKVFISTGDALDKMNKRTGVSVKDLSNLGLAASLAGTSIDRVEKVLLRISQAMSKAREGTQSYIDDFERLGITLEDLKDKSPLDVFREIAKATQDLTPDQKSGLLGSLFGRRGVGEVLPLLDRFEDQISSVEKLDIGITGEEAIAAAELNDSITILVAQLKKLASVVGGQIKPQIEDVTESLQKATKWFTNFIEVHPRITKALVNIGGLFLTVGAGLLALAGALKVGGIAFGAFLVTVSKAVGVFTALKIGIVDIGTALANFGPALSAIYGILIKNIGMFFKALLINPKGVLKWLVILAKTDLPLLSNNFYRAAINGGKFSAILFKIGGSLKPLLAAIVATKGGVILLSAAIAYVSYKFAEWIGKLSGVHDWLGKNIRKLLEWTALWEEVEDMGGDDEESGYFDDKRLNAHIKMLDKLKKQGDITEENYQKQKKAIDELRKAREKWLKSEEKAAGMGFEEWRQEQISSPAFDLSVGGVSGEVERTPEEEAAYKEEQERMALQVSQRKFEVEKAALKLQYDGEALQKKLLKLEKDKADEKYAAEESALLSLKAEYQAKQQILQQEYEQAVISSDQSENTLASLEFEYQRNQEILKQNYEQASVKYQGAQEMLNAINDEYNANLELLRIEQERARVQKEITDEQNRQQRANSMIENIHERIEEAMLERAYEGYRLEYKKLELARERAKEEAEMAGVATESVDEYYDILQELLKKQDDLAKEQKTEAAGTFSSAALSNIFGTGRELSATEKNTKKTADGIDTLVGLAQSGRLIFAR